MTYGTTEPDRATAARVAYEKADVEASIKVHQTKKADEGHRQGGDFIKSIVYGGIDGILTCFSILAGASGGDLDPNTVLIVGISNIVADAFAMGVGDYISTKSYTEHVDQERRREEWEYDNYPEGEIEEMIELYEQRGLPREKAEIVIKTMSKPEYKDFFIDIMMLEELELKVPDEDDDPRQEAVAIFLSFMFFGMIPLLAYMIFPVIFPKAGPGLLFANSSICTLLVLFSLGAFKTKVSGDTNFFKAGMEFLILGGLAACTSYFIGAIVKDITAELLN